MDSFISRFSKCEYHVRVTVPMAEPSELPSSSPGADDMSYIDIELNNSPTLNRGKFSSIFNNSMCYRR